MTGQAAVELKGGMYTLLSIQIHSIEQEAIALALKNKVQQAPGFFKDTPVVVDLSPVEHMEELDTIQLLETIREHNLVAIAARVSDKTSPAASTIQLPVLDASGATNKSPSTDDISDDTDQSKNTEHPEAATISVETRIVDIPITGPMIITRPVRSGQQVYAQGGELVVMAQAGPGAELIADSNIHVYGPLRGRALCGVTGNTKARIFCRSLEAELVSVAGIYKPLEEIPADLKGKPAQIWLDGDKLVIEAMT